MITGRIPLQHAERFILSGGAYFFFHNSQSDNKERYYVKEKSDSLYYVYAHSSSRKYLGRIKFRKFYSAKDISGRSVEVFKWVWERITRLTLPPAIHVYHEGRCGVCGRPLIDPESILLGIGPICRGKLFTKSS